MIHRRYVVMVAVAVGLVYGGLVSGASAVVTAGVSNTQLATVAGDSTVVLDSGLVVFDVAEASQGGTDLNTDGDTSDQVVHVFNPATKTSVNTGLAMFIDLVALGNRAAFSVREVDQGGVDLNEDGDTSDTVVYVFDPATGTATNTALATSGGLVAAGSRVAFFVSEFSQGGVDLNGNGNSGDQVVHVFDPATATATNLARVGDSFADLVAMGDRIAFGVSEFWQSETDLNGDGDFGDDVLHIFDPNTGLTTNTLLAKGSGLAAVGDLVAFGVPEAFQDKTDLNGDGDYFDKVGFVFDPATMIATNTRLAYSSIRPPTAVGGRVSLEVSESAQGNTDLNGDGDTTDSVLQVFDPVAMTVASSRLAVGAAGNHVAVGNRVAFTVGEAEQGGTDLNSDGDTADAVVHVFDPATDAVANTGVERGGLSGFNLVAAGGQLVFDVREGERGMDLNGDGDTADSVVHLFDPATSTATSTGRAFGGFGTTLVAGGNLVAFAVPEGAQGATDLNGDGDVFESVAHVLDQTDATVLNLELAVDRTFVVERNIVAFRVSELDQGKDLNGDGDQADSVKHVVTLAPNRAPVAVNDGPFTVARGGTLQVNGVLDNDTDADGNPLTAIKVSDPAHGTLSLSADGSFTYGHDGSASSADSFTYRANDGSANSNVGTVSINVTAAQLETAGLVDPSQGQWHLRNSLGQITTFFYGNPGDVPFMGDWDCDGTATPGLFRQSDAFAYLRNSNTVGIADIKFFFGNPSDVPLAGDFNGDGCDTVSIYRPSEQRFYIINKLGQNNGGLGAADFFFTFGNPGDKPVVGDWDGDGIDEVGLHRETTGFFYWRNTLDTGVASGEIFFGDPGDRFVAGDWGIVDRADTPAVFRPANTTFFFRHTLTQGVADSQFVFGESGWLPVAGRFGLG